MTDEADTPEDDTGAAPVSDSPVSDSDIKAAPSARPRQAGDNPAASADDTPPADNAPPAKKKRKYSNKQIGFGIGGLLLALIIFYGIQPVQGSIRYGVCKVFVEMRLRYPTSMQVNMVEEYATLVRMFYSATDAFGSTKLHMVECEYAPDPVTGFRLDAVRIDRDAVPAAEIIPFNATIPFIVQNPPDLSRPSFRSDELVDLKITYN